MLKVLKFGGTSVGGLDRIQNVANIIKKLRDEGDSIVAVVSAMSGETNKLIEYAHNYTKTPDEREMDTLLSSGERVTSALLSITLNNDDYKCISMSGREAGIRTTSDHTQARIKTIDTKNLKQKIDDGFIIIVAGFQGSCDETQRVTTLGRGGSDLSAVAIAGALQADVCEIYTDVDGIYTTDPRIEPRAKKMEKISYDEMLELSSLGAKVLQNRSVEMAKKLNVKLISRSSFTPEIAGTLITKEEDIMESPIVSGIAIDRDQVRIGLYKISDKPGMAASIFRTLSLQNINVDMIVQTVAVDGKADLDFTVDANHFEKTKNIIENFKDDIESFDYNEDICKVSIVGIGMKSNTGVAATAFETMSNENINIRIISTSEIKISMIIDSKYGELAVRALHEAYKMHA